MSADDFSKLPQWFATSPFRGFRDSPPPPIRADVEFGAHSRRGPQRLANEDHYLVLQLGGTRKRS